MRRSNESPINCFQIQTIAIVGVICSLVHSICSMLSLRLHQLKEHAPDARRQLQLRPHQPRRVRRQHHAVFGRRRAHKRGSTVHAVRHHREALERAPLQVERGVEAPSGRLAVPAELLTLEKLKASVMPAKVIVNGFAKSLDETKMPLAGAGQPPPHCR